MATIARQIKVIPRVIYLSLKRLYQENYAYQAAALAFTTLLSLVPIISIIFYFFSFFSAFNQFIILAENYIYTNFIPSNTNAVREYLNQFIHQTHQLPFISILFSVVTGIIMILTVEDAMNSIWHTQYKKRHLVAAIISWSVLLLMPVFVGFIVFLNATFSTLFMTQYQSFVLHLINLLTNCFLLGCVYIVFPNAAISWKDALAGGLVASILFEMIKRLFIFYISYLTSYEYIYGALAAIPIFLLWIYVAWLIILFGALFIHTKNKLLNVTHHRAPSKK